MRRLVTALSLCSLAACSKNASDKTATAPVLEAQLQQCDFGITDFNLVKREPLVGMDKRPGGGGGGTTTPPPPTSNPGVILLDFNGHYVTGTAWNYAGSFTCAPANLSATVIDNIVNRVANDYAPFNITVTTDENVYNAANAYRRMRVVLTETWEWFGQAGGTSLLNTFTAGTNTPCFVFTSLLNYSEKKLAEAATHEAGHTFGLHHQAVYNGTTLVSQYNYGQGGGETGWAPIMGCGYYQNLSTWHNGTSAQGYSVMQDEVAIISSKVGMRTDDYANSTSGAALLSTALNGYMNTRTDVDFFSVNIASSRTIAAIPANVGAGNEGANLDLIIKIYNAQGQLISTVEDPASLSASTVLNPGQYYIAISTTTNQYATSNYGMLDKYTVSLN